MIAYILLGFLLAANIAVWLKALFAFLSLHNRYSAIQTI